MSSQFIHCTNKESSEEQICHKLSTKENDLKMLESKFFSLPSQGSIYTITSHRLKNGCQSIVIFATLHKVYFLYHNEAYAINEIDLPFSTSESDITALDTMEMEGEDNFLLGVIQIKNESQEKSPECNVWFCTIPSFSIDTLTPIKFETLTLPFLPYQLYATCSVLHGTKESVWLLSGSDWSIHLFRSNYSNMYEESNVELFFPEISPVTEICLCIDINYDIEFKTRTTVLGSESGTVNIFRVDLLPELPRVTASQQICWDFPIASVRLFYRRNKRHHLDVDVNEPEMQERDDLSAVVGTTLEGSYVYRDCLQESSSLLANSSADDVITCCLVCDIDFDGENEVVIGTYGKVLTIYDYSDVNGWTVLKRLQFDSPVTAIRYESLTDSGVCDLVIITNSGIHVYEHDSAHCFALIKQRLQSITEKENILWLQ